MNLQKLVFSILDKIFVIYALILVILFSPILGLAAIIWIFILGKWQIAVSLIILGLILNYRLLTVFFAPFAILWDKVSTSFVKNQKIELILNILFGYFFVALNIFIVLFIQSIVLDLKINSARFIPIYYLVMVISLLPLGEFSKREISRPGLMSIQLTASIIATVISCFSIYFYRVGIREISIIHISTSVILQVFHLFLTKMSNQKVINFNIEKLY